MRLILHSFVWLFVCGVFLVVLLCVRPVPLVTMATVLRRTWLLTPCSRGGGAPPRLGLTLT